MSWGEIFFGFHGRINRKTYWFGGVLVAIAGLSFASLLSYLATGDPASPDVWQRPADKAGLWAPVWLAYLVFLLWPSSALAIKRLHDRDRPAWLWYLYYGASIILTLAPIRSAAGADANPAAGAAMLALIIFEVYIVFQLGVLRGTAGQNQFGGDTMPPGYYGGDYSFWSWMFALEGRISRSKWWLGVSIVTGTIIAASILMALLVGTYISQHPEFEQNLSNPQWAESKEAAPLILNLMLRSFLPSLLFLAALWSLVALGIKRLHDRGLSSWLILVVVLPFLGALISPALVAQYGISENAASLAFLLFAASVIWSVLQFGILKGDTGPNEHGPDPLAGQS